MRPCATLRVRADLAPVQVMRVIGAFKLNPYEVLELNWMPSATVTEADIRASLCRISRVTR